MKQQGIIIEYLNTINNLILERVMYKLTQLELNPQSTKTDDFDVMMGLSGVTNYLLIYHKDKDVREIISRVIKYFVNLTKRIDYREYNLPNYYINNENQFTEFDRQLYKNGCINFSLSHGISGPMLIMSKALELGIEVDGQGEAIKLMLDDLLEYSYTNENGYRLFTGRIGLENYINKDIDKVNSRAAWCYGAPGITKAIYGACSVIKNEKALEIADSALEFMLKYPNKWELNSPTICHGLSGLLAYFESLDMDNYIITNQIKNLAEILINMYDESSIFGYKDINVKKNETGQYVPRVEDKINFLSGTIG